MPNPSNKPVIDRPEPSLSVRFRLWFLTGGTGPPPAWPAFLRMTAQRLRQGGLEAEFKEARQKARDEFDERWGANGLKGMTGSNRAREERARLRAFGQGRQKEAEGDEGRREDCGDGEGGGRRVEEGDGRDGGQGEEGEGLERGGDGG